MIPGGFVAASQAIREQIDGARERLDVMNAYLTDHDMIERMVAAARRGVKVRVVVSEKSNASQATAALKHHYADLIAAGAEIWELPGTVVHAKVVVADDVVSFGTVNLDAWALYRNSEIAMIAHSPQAAGLMRERLFEPDIARARRGVPPSGTPRAVRELAVGQAWRRSSRAFTRLRGCLATPSGHNVRSWSPPIATRGRPSSRRSLQGPPSTSRLTSGLQRAASPALHS